MQSIIRFLKNVWNAQRNADDLIYERDTSERWYQRCVEHAKARAEAETENAALRQQVSKRDSSGRFAPKNTGQ